MSVIAHYIEDLRLAGYEYLTPQRQHQHDLQSRAIIEYLHRQELGVVGYSIARFIVAMAVLMRRTRLLSIIPTEQQLDAAYTLAAFELEKGEHHRNPYKHPAVIDHIKTRKASART